MLMIPIFLYGRLLYVRSSEQISTQTLNHSTEILRQMSGSIDTLVEDLDTLSILPYTYRTSSFKSIQDFLSITFGPDQGDDIIEGLSEYKTFNELIKYTLNTKKYINTVMIITTSGDVYYEDKKGDYLIDDYNFSEVSWMKTVLANPSKLTIIPTHKQDYMYHKRDVLTFARNILDIKQVSSDMKGRILGTIILDIDIDVFTDVCNSNSAKMQGQIVILSDKGELIYSNQPENLGAIPEWYDDIKYRLVDNNNNFILSSKKNEKIFNYYKNQKTGWIILNIVEKNELLRSIYDLKKLYNLILILFIIELPVMLLVFYFRISLPMRNILTVMKNAEQGNLEVRVQMNNRTEFGLISIGFNTMLDKLTHFINKTYVTEKKQREAELDALKSQIDPHYLYNTLEAIRMSAIISESPEVADMISSLSMQLRYTVGRGKDIVRICDEMDNIKNYFSLLKIRYRDRVNLVIDIDEQIAQFCTLRLTLQPLVENAVIHGILKKDEGGTIWIHIEKFVDYFKIIVSDDGVGLGEEELGIIEHILLDDSTYAAGLDKGKKNNRIGLKNVHDRIKTYFGDSYGISIKERPNTGVSVEMKLPFLREDDIYD